MRPFLFLSRCAVVLALVSGGCAAAYSSMYKQKDGSFAAKPVPAKDVKVVKSRDDLVSKWAEVGSYRGHAPTVNEAMTAAKQQCGTAGADLFILNTPPFASENSWKVDGVCAHKQ